MRATVLIAMYAVLAGLVYLFTGQQVARSLGGPGFDNAPCVAAWLAHRSFLDWLVSTPYPEIAGFFAATALTIWWVRRRRPETAG